MLVVLGSTFGCTGGNALTSTTGALPACTYAGGLGTIDAPVSGACTAARVALSCETGGNQTGGGGQFCLSNALGQCPNPESPPSDVSSPRCTDQCNPDEYGVWCSVGSAAGPSPPDGCRVGLASPGGAIYCCPCI